MFEGLTGHVSIEVAGRIHTAAFEVRAGFVRVMSQFGDAALELGSMAMHPEYIARFLLEDLVRAADDDGS